MILDYIMAIIGTAAITAIFVSYYWKSETVDWNDLYFRSCKMQSDYERQVTIWKGAYMGAKQRCDTYLGTCEDLQGLLDDARHALLDPEFVENPVLYLDLGYYLNSTIIDGKYSNQGEENASNIDRGTSIARWKNHREQALPH